MVEWSEIKAAQLQKRRELITQCIEEREFIHKNHLEALLQEEVELDTVVLQLEARGFVFQGDTNRV
jgi:hypothetical protein